jgi:predicted dehydrogenase
MHAEWTVRALEAGKHVLCEKPMALNVAEADRVARTALACNRVLMENFSYQLTPAYRDLPPLAAHKSKALQSIDIHQSFFATEDHNLRYIRELGGGSFLDVGCYGVDFVHRLLDSQIEIADVIAIPPPPERGASGFIDETCILRGRTAGIAVSITSSFAQPPRQDYTLQFAAGRFAAGDQHQIVRIASPVALLDAFASATQTDPADILRWRRNASVYEQALGRMQY